MRHILIMICACLFGCIWTASGEDSSDRDIRLMSYNIRNCMGMDGITDYQRIANIIEKVAPDVLALQEVDSMTNRSNHHDVLVELAKRTAMYPIFAKAIDYDGGKYGIGAEKSRIDP